MITFPLKSNHRPAPSDRFDYPKCIYKDLSHFSQENRFRSVQEIYISTLWLLMPSSHIRDQNGSDFNPLLGPTGRVSVSLYFNCCFLFPEGGDHAGKDDVDGKGTKIVRLNFDSSMIGAGVRVASWNNLFPFFIFIYHFWDATHPPLFFHSLMGPSECVCVRYFWVVLTFLSFQICFNLLRYSATQVRIFQGGVDWLLVLMVYFFLSVE